MLLRTETLPHLEADLGKQFLDGFRPVLPDGRPPLRPPPPPSRAASGGAVPSARRVAVDEGVARGFLGKDFDVDEFEVAYAGRAFALPEPARIHRYYFDEVAALKCKLLCMLCREKDAMCYVQSVRKL